MSVLSTFDLLVSASGGRIVLANFISITVSIVVGTFRGWNTPSCLSSLHSNFSILIKAGPTS